MVLCLYFWHLLHCLKNCKIYHVLHWYTSLAQFFLKSSSLRLIWGHLCSFQLIYRLTHLSSFRAILSSFRIILNVSRVFWICLVSFRPIVVYLGSFKLLWVHLDSLELITAHLDSFRLIYTYSSWFELIWVLVSLLKILFKFNNYLLESHPNAGERHSF